MRIIDNFYELDCQIFRNINRHHNQRILNSVLQIVTQMGGATFTISITLILLAFTTHSAQMIAVASAISLAFSHVPVAIMKKLYPRKRPYLSLDKINVLANPLEDHSFPSSHTTAIFSIIIPFVLLYPPLAMFLIPVGILVGISRVFLGLHYPSDVVAGSILGSTTAFFSYLLIQTLFPHVI